MAFDFKDKYNSGVKIKVIGVGGGGGNAINRMVESEIRDVEFIAMNTDGMALDASLASKKVILGESVTKRFGAGANPDIGRQSAEESIEAIREAIEGANMVFVTAGMGGGTGTGAAPIVAKIAHDMGILTIGIVTKPFNFEGKRRMMQAEAGIAALKDHVDSLIIIPNEKLKQVSAEKVTLQNAFAIADDVLRLGVKSVSELINVPGFVNLDFADVTSVMKDSGFAYMGVGKAHGEDKATVAANAATSSPLFESSIDGATGLLVNITVSNDVGLDEVDLASTIISEKAAPDANIIWGASFSPELSDEMHITIIATGFTNTDNYREAAYSKLATEANRAIGENVDIASEQKEETPITSPKTQEYDEDDEDEFIRLIQDKRRSGF